MTYTREMLPWHTQGSRSTIHPSNGKVHLGWWYLNAQPTSTKISIAIEWRTGMMHHFINGAHQDCVCVYFHAKLVHQGGSRFRSIVNLGVWTPQVWVKLYMTNHYMYNGILLNEKITQPNSDLLSNLRWVTGVWLCVFGKATLWVWTLLPSSIPLIPRCFWQFA